MSFDDLIFRFLILRHSRNQAECAEVYEQLCAWLEAPAEYREYAEQVMFPAYYGTNAPRRQRRATTDPAALFNDLWKLINRLMVAAGDMLWLEDGSSAHEALLDIAEKYAPEVAMELDSRLADGDSGLYFAKDAPASDHQALRDALLNGGSYWTLADIYQSSGDAAYLPKHVMDRHEVVALAEQIAAL